MFRLGENFFVKGPPPPQVKGKNFDTRFGLIHVQTGEKFYVEGPPSQNSKDLLWLRGGRYASCVHAGLSCFVVKMSFLLFIINTKLSIEESLAHNIRWVQVPDPS